MQGSRETADSRGAAHPLHTALLLCAIATPLILAGILERDPATESPAVAAREAVSSVPTPSERPEPDAPRSVAEPPAAVPTPAPVPDSAESPSIDLAARARDDAARLRGEAGFTLQFAVMCRDENLRQILADVGANPSVYVLPAAVDGQPCHRLCFGRYATEAAARGAASPGALRAVTDAPRPVSLAQVVP